MSPVLFPMPWFEQRGNIQSFPRKSAGGSLVSVWFTQLKLYDWCKLFIITISAQQHQGAIKVLPKFTLHWYLMTANQIGISYRLVQKILKYHQSVQQVWVCVCVLSHVTTRATVLVKSLISNQSPAMTGLLEQACMCRGAVIQGFTHILFTTNYALISRNLLIPLHALCTVLCTHFLSLL